MDSTEFAAERENYKSDKGIESVLEAQFEEDAKEGMCFKLLNEEASRLYPGGTLRIAAIGAIEKADSSFRVIHDATHGVQVNNQAIMRDRMRMPGPREEKYILRKTASSKEQCFVLQTDVSKAHRRFLYREED